jgi:hypothetical protein
MPVAIRLSRSTNSAEVRVTNIDVASLIAAPNQTPENLRHQILLLAGQAVGDAAMVAPRSDLQLDAEVTAFQAEVNRRKAARANLAEV